MHHDSIRSSSVFLFSKRSSSLISARDVPQNFAETLPTEMSVRIFGELDAESLCSASRTCKLWHHIIEGSDQVWRRQCLLVRAVCQREVDSDRSDGLSWKVGRLLGQVNFIYKAHYHNSQFASDGFTAYDIPLTLDPHID
ncbi:F-box only protein 48 [Plectropomus leopardus]|uniref:F-box only protein 48 n=1 Tax=Plectropomus leopardus TaxID=160734 RepID=UPI001C4D872D|nr:F-box only protein 48 [Plectropomus leopardus]